MNNSRFRIRPFAGYFFVFLLSLTGIVLYGLSGGISWVGLRPSPCFPNCFCEAFHPGSIIQPLSSCSNLWYVLVGLGIIASTRISLPNDSRRTNPFLRQPAFITTYGIVVILVGLTSLFYHVSLTLVGRWADYGGMYAFASFAVVYNLARLQIVRGWSFAISYVTLNLGLLIPMMEISSLSVKRALLLGAILAMIGLEVIIYLRRRSTHPRYDYFLPAVGIMAAATGFNLLDESGLWCHPTSLWQWHAAWHFMTAVTIGLLYLHYRTENDREAQSTV